MSEYLRASFVVRIANLLLLVCPNFSHLFSALVVIVWILLTRAVETNLSVNFTLTTALPKAVVIVGSVNFISAGMDEKTKTGLKDKDWREDGVSLLQTCCIRMRNSLGSSGKI